MDSIKKVTIVGCEAEVGGKALCWNRAAAGGEAWDFGSGESEVLGCGPEDGKPVRNGSQGRFMK